jgi:hypothetical protein
MLGSIREIVWRSTWNKGSYEIIKRFYAESCDEAPKGSIPSFDELPKKFPYRFSSILEIISDALVCNIEKFHGSDDLKAYLVSLKTELLKLYVDLISEEREYGVSLRPHKIERLLDLLNRYI